MRTDALIAAWALLLACPAAAQEQPAPSSVPSPLALAASLAGGGEAGLASGPSGLLELELLVGWEFPATAAGAGLTIRPELAVALGSAPDSNQALRPGVRLSIPETPLWLRAAGDWSNARGQDSHWRWVLVGVAWEVRVTGSLGLSIEFDTGIPLASSAGLPLMARVGATFRP